MTKGVLLLILLSSIIWARGFSPDIEDSLRTMHPRMWARWLELHGIKDEYYSKPFNRDSLNVRCVGRWSYGPSYEITGKTVGNNTYLFLSRGSGVSALRFVSADSIELLSDINASGLVMQSIVKDTLLYVGCYGVGIEIYNISNLQNPRLINRIITAQNDFFVKDTLLYTISNDTFKIINVANPQSPNTLGAVSESGTGIYVSGNYAYLADRWGLYILNVSNPANPTRIGSWGTHIVTVSVKDTFCYLTTGNTAGNRFYVLSISNPAAPYELGHLDNLSCEDIYVIDYFVYLPDFYIIDVSNPSFLTIIGHLALLGWKHGVWVANPFAFSFVAGDYEGLRIVNITNPTNPQLDTSLLKADDSYKLIIRDSLGYLANRFDGLKIINLSQPTLPIEIGSYDTISNYNLCYSLALKDTFVYMQWSRPQTLCFHSVNVSDPRNPRPTGIVQMTNDIEDIVVRDTFAYLAKDGRFEIFSIANPYLLRWVGSCTLPDDAYGMCFQDTFAYVANQYAGLTIVNIANSNAPNVVGTFSLPGWTNGVFVKDTLAYVASLDIGLRIVNIKNPLAPFEVSSFPTGQTYDVVVKDSFAYVGCTSFKVIDISNPSIPIEIGHYTTPFYVRRVNVDSNYIYCVCFGAGMCIFKRLPAGIEENENSTFSQMFSILPNPVFDKVIIRLNIQQGGEYEVSIYNALGKLVNKGIVLNKRAKEITLNLSSISNGVYFVSVRNENRNYIRKIIKINRGR
jgi:hypothetical protein